MSVLSYHSYISIVAEASSPAAESKDYWFKVRPQPPQRAYADSEGQVGWVTSGCCEHP